MRVRARVRVRVRVRAICGKTKKRRAGRVHLHAKWASLSASAQSPVGEWNTWVCVGIWTGFTGY